MSENQEELRKFLWDYTALMGMLFSLGTLIFHPPGSMTNVRLMYTLGVLFAAVLMRFVNHLKTLPAHHDDPDSFWDD